MGEKTTKAIITPNCANHAKGGRGEGFSAAAAFFFSCCAQQEVHCHTRNTTVGVEGRGGGTMIWFLEYTAKRKE